MALVIYNENGVGANRSLPLAEPLGAAVISKVMFIRADGFELEYIRKQYTNAAYLNSLLNVNAVVLSIPMTVDAKNMIWWGDIAKTILSNL